MPTNQYATSANRKFTNLYRIVFLSFVACLFSVHLWAQNLVVNPNFTSTASWTGDNGSILSLDGTTGNLSAPSGLVTGPGGVAVQCSQCVPISTTGVSYAFGANMMPLNNSSTLILTIVWYDGGNCSGNITGQSQTTQASPTQMAWHALAGNGTAPALTVSADIEIVQNTGTAGVQFNVDDVYLGANDTPVELQSLSVE